MRKKEKEENQNKKEIKQKKHFDPAKGAVRIIALLLVIIMLGASCASAIFYLVYSIQGLI